MWSRVASFSITVVSPGAARPASSTADLSCADGTGGSYTIGIGSRAPCSVTGSRPPSRTSWVLRAHALQRIEHALHRPRAQEASPSNVAVIGQPATAPIASRQPVPELPKSSGAAGVGKAADADARAPARRRSPVRSTIGAERLHRVGGADGRPRPPAGR